MGPTLDHLRAMLGDEDAEKLIIEFGGLRTYVPSQHERETLALLRILSRESVAKLASEFGGNYVKVPLARGFLITQFYKNGLGNREIATRLRVTESAVERHLKVARKRGEISQERRSKALEGEAE